MNIDIELLLALASKKDLSIEKGFETFLNHIFEFKNIETYKYHKTYYNALIPFLEKHDYTKMSEINNEFLLKYIEYARSRGNKNTTINKKIASIKYCVSYLSKMELITPNKINIDKLPNDEERFQVLTKEEIAGILAFAQTLEPKRHLQILLMLYTGIRRTELVKILLCNIKDDYIILDYTKNRKKRNIYLTQEMKSLIDEVRKDSKVYLFENQAHTKHECADSICNIFKLLERRTGIKTHPHSLRHTFATQLLENGADLESIRLLLGHSDYTMIMRYVHIKNKRLAELSTNLYITK